MEQKRKSIIRKKIGRKIQTKMYESLDVNVEIEEEIEWSDLKERQQKTDGISKILIKDYKKTMTQVLEDLKLSQIKATVTSDSKESSNELIKKVEEEADSLF
ncbi:MAG TPA: hypothetical protein VMZ91_06975 [Candidatus Paceibacterota bacterium]|nr:hypothetical protein [Candidatus Paceibacterota bacterium]